jgi:hypothetical protein
MKLIISIISLFFFINSVLYAACNFNTAKKISELHDPSYINRISVDVPKSGKFEKNFFKIISSKTVNIPKNLKKNFRANIIVEYKFGNCVYKAKVKQNGDMRDHIMFQEGGKPFRSLTVKLKDGNILNAVNFKLLIPKTRNNLNEILGSIIMRELNFISPETFLVKVNLNKVESIMLFQEDAKKELLERNLRREGPIFEGDESILWSEGMSGLKELSQVSLTRLTNPKWFLKGESSQQIVISAFHQLQRAYLETPSQFFVLPNKKSLKKFADFAFLSIAMNGDHGLIESNRRFYFNSFTDEFEPIYYDGNLKFEKLNPDSIRVLKKELEFPKNYKFLQISKFDDPNFIKKISKKFKKRVLENSTNNNIFLKEGILNFKDNLIYLEKYLSERKLRFVNNIQNLNNNTDYMAKLRDLEVDQENISSIELNNKNFFIKFGNKKEQTVTPFELSRIFSKSTLSKKRTVFLPTASLEKNIKNSSTINRESILNGTITYSAGITINMDDENKKINIIQSKPTEWIFFSDINFIDWEINFTGNIKNLSDLNQSQRFNKNGLTGCVNFYNSHFENISLIANGGGCEDSINIVSSKGKINSIVVENAYADAVDLDFSNLKIKKIIIKNSGNDCLDVSGGTYEVVSSSLELCKDKAISVGEKSFFQINNVNINDAAIGISAKDFSTVILNNGKIKNAKVCVEAAQKKQEFGGGLARLNKIICEGEYLIDNYSIIERSSL